MRDYLLRQQVEDQKLPVNFAKFLNSLKIANDAVIELEKFKKAAPKTVRLDIPEITQAIARRDLPKLREISNYFYSISGIYARMLKYLAGILTYDFYVYPYLLKDKKNVNSVQNGLYKILNYMDNLNPKVTFYKIALKTLLNGVYYGYLVNNDAGTCGTILELPVDYCRVRTQINNQDYVEFNIDFFDRYFPDQTQRELALSSFPKEFRQAYQKKQRDLLPLDRQTGGHWFYLDQIYAMRFSFSTFEIPPMVAVIPTLLELEQAKQLDLKKTMQELLKIIVQKMPLDKNDDLVFDIDESRELHNNAVAMLRNAVNVDVLTTFADVDAIDLDNSTATSNNDPPAKVERQVFNEAGISQMLFATDGNIALEKSIQNDEALMFFFLGQIEAKLNSIINDMFGSRALRFKVCFPKHSIYNVADKAKLYKEMANSGYSKTLAPIAMGQSQSEFLSMIDFENDVLNLTERLTPSQISSTQSAKGNSNNANKNVENQDSEEKKVGAPELEDSKKSEKTIQNKESQS